MFGMATMTINVATLYDKSREVLGHPSFIELSEGIDADSQFSHLTTQSSVIPLDCLDYPLLFVGREQV